MERLPNLRKNYPIQINGKELYLSELNMELLKILANSENTPVSVPQLGHAWDKLNGKPTNVKNALAKLSKILGNASDIDDPIVKIREEHPLHTNRPKITYTLSADIKVLFLDKEA